MPNPLKGEVPFSVADQDYTLIFTTNAIIALEEEIGQPISKVGEVLGDNVSLGALRNVLWAGLLDRHDLSKEQVGDLIDGIGMARAAELIADGMAKAFPQSRGGSRPRKPATGTGKAS